MKLFEVLNDHSFTYNGITFGIFKDEYGTELNTIFNDSWDPVDDYCYFDTGHLTIDETIDHLKDNLKYWNETVEKLKKLYKEQQNEK